MNKWHITIDFGRFAPAHLDTQVLDFVWSEGDHSRKNTDYVFMDALRLVVMCSINTVLYSIDLRTGQLTCRRRVTEEQEIFVPKTIEVIGIIDNINMVWQWNKPKGGVLHF